MESTGAAAELLWGLLRGVRALLPRSARLFVLTGGGRRAALVTPRHLEEALSFSGPARPSEVVPGVPPYEVTVRAVDGAEDLLHLTAGISTSGKVRAPGVLIEVGLAERALSSAEDPAGTAEALFGLLVGNLALDAALAVPGDVTPPPELPRRARVGWLTFLPERLGPLPPLPPHATSSFVSRRGWIVRAHRDLPRSGAAEYSEALAHLRHVLGARVLLDGPSFPPSAAPDVRAPPLESAVARTPGIPSYLRAPPVVPVATAPERPAVVAATAAPFSTATVDIDVSKILQPAVPFDPDAPAAATAIEAPVAARSFGETEEFRLDALLQRPRPVPFEAAPMAPPPNTAAPEAAPQRRLVRFDPQTGQPIAQPYWEELPAPGKKTGGP